MQIYAFDTSASPGKSAAKGLATYKSAACRMFLYVQMTSQPANETVGPAQLFVPRAGNTAEMAARRQLLSKVLHIPTCKWKLPLHGSCALADLLLRVVLLCRGFSEEGAMPVWS